jgi:hypothetical protein
MRRLAALLLLAALVPAAAHAQDRPSWNGTWAGGWDKGVGVQITFAGDAFVGMCWRGDYLDGVSGETGPNGKSATIQWSGGEVALTRETSTTVRVTLRETGGKLITVELKKD